MPSLEKISSNRVSTGTLTKYKFASSSLSDLETQFNIFVPSSASPSLPVPVLFYLAGLTCNEDTGCQKGGFLNAAGEHGIAVVCPDTSPRGAGVPGEDDDWQLGTGRHALIGSEPGSNGLQSSCRCAGAGFYVNATDKKWEKYRMYDLITKELPHVLKEADLGLVRFLTGISYPS
jgi:S-formylglutathione hydrolase